MTKPTTKTYTFSVLSDEEALKVRQGTSAAWFDAIVEGQTIKIDSRPEPTKAQREYLDQYGYRLRTKKTGEGDHSVYAWIEPTDEQPAAEEPEEEVPTDAP